MQFQVPQFIEVEDKIFGPLTFKQFIYIFGGFGGSYIVWRVLPLFLAAPLILAVCGLAAGLAFFQFNGRPFIQGIENAFYFFVRGKLYLWDNSRKTPKPREAIALAPKASQVYVPKLSESRLHDLAWSLDIKERIAQGTAAEDERVDARDGIVVPMRTAQQARI